MKHLMIIEDEISLQNILEEILTDEGYEVSLFSDGLAALEKLKTTPPDMILTDFNLPKISGKEFIERIRTMDHLKNIPIIIMSGQLNIEETAAELAVYDYLKKPYHLDTLIEKITNYFVKF